MTKEQAQKALELIEQIERLEDEVRILKYRCDLLENPPGNPVDYRFNIYRDCDSWRLRKVVVELYRNGKLIHRTRMFAGLNFARRLESRKIWMLRLAEEMQ